MTSLPRHCEKQSNEAIQSQEERGLGPCDSGWLRYARNDDFIVRGILSLLFLFFLVLPARADTGSVNPKVIEVTSPGGIKALLVPDKNLPLISMRFAFRGGVEADPADKQGLATLTANLLTQGAGPYDAQAFQEKLAALSIAFSVDAGRDAITGGLKTLRRNRAEAFRLAALALTEPRLAEQDFLRLRNQQETARRAQESDPGWQARYALFQDVFKGHPYSYRSLGSRQTLAAITREDVKTFARQRLAKDNLLVAAVGDISPKELGAALDTLFGALPAKAAPLTVPEVAEPEKPETILVSRPGTQTDFLFAGPMMKRDNPDWYAAQIANYILGGGGFVSRLMAAVRNDEGLTYGVSTGLAPMDHASLLVGQMAADNDKAGKAWALARKVWQAFYDKGATGPEIEAAKDYLTGSMPLGLTSTDSIASTLLSMQLDKLGADYLDRRNDLIRRVTPQDVNRAIRVWFNPSKLTAVFVGAPEGVTANEERSLTED